MGPTMTGHAAPAPEAMAVAEGRAVPLSEQLLARLPGPGRLWVAAWLLVPWLNLLVVWATGANGQGVPARRCSTAPR